MNKRESSKHGLTAPQIKFFEEEGYLILRELFTDADLQRPIDDIQRTIDASTADLMRRGELSQSYAGLDFEHRLGAISQETDQVALGMWNGVLHGPGFFALITNPRLLDVAESLCGDELIPHSLPRPPPSADAGESGRFELRCD